MKTDAELVAIIRRGETQAFTELFKRHERSVLAIALSVLRDNHLAQDVVQESFMVAYQKINSLRSPKAFGAWLRRIARRQALDVADKQRPIQKPISEPSTQSMDKPLLKEEQQQLLDAVQELPHHEQIVVSLFYFEGHNANEVSTITGRPVGTITMQLSRARTRLKQQLGEFDHE